MYFSVVGIHFHICLRNTRSKGQSMHKKQSHVESQLKAVLFISVRAIISTKYRYYNSLAYLFHPFALPFQFDFHFRPHRNSNSDDRRPSAFPPHHNQDKGLFYCCTSLFLFQVIQCVDANFVLVSFLKFIS